MPFIKYKKMIQVSRTVISYFRLEKSFFINCNRNDDIYKIYIM